MLTLLAVVITAGWIVADQVRTRNLVADLIKAERSKVSIPAWASPELFFMNYSELVLEAGRMLGSEVQICAEYELDAQDGPVHLMARARTSTEKQIAIYERFSQAVGRYGMSLPSVQVYTHSAEQAALGLKGSLA